MENELIDLVKNLISTLVPRSKESSLLLHDGSKQFAKNDVDSSKYVITNGNKDMFEKKRNILEPTGALALAGAEAYCKHHAL
ncbi:hypothetical protein JHK87_034840 [Glycine soja]|nr:hypothetical protein JHK87_034840 [Glycine soja]